MFTTAFDIFFVLHCSSFKVKCFKDFFGLNFRAKDIERERLRRILKFEFTVLNICGAKNSREWKFLKRKHAKYPNEEICKYAGCFNTQVPPTELLIEYATFIDRL